MDNKKFYGIFFVAIIAVVAMVLVLSVFAEKESVDIKMLSNNSLGVGDSIKIQLIDSNGGGISNKTINVKLIDEKGNIDEYSTDTDEKGNAKLKLNNVETGNYTVNFTFSGDDKYKGFDLSEKIEIKEVADVSVQETASGSNDGSSNSDDSGFADTAYFYDDEFAGGQYVRQNTYKNGNFEHYYEDGSYDYYDVKSGRTYYKTADGEYGVVDPYDY